MRFILFFAGIATLLTVLYKWRYKIVNTLLAISFLRKLAISLSFKMPTMKSTIIPNLFKTSNP